MAMHGWTRRRALGFGAIAGLLMALSVVVSPLRAGAVGDQARVFIEGLAETAVAALTEPNVARDERERRARTLLTENFAVPTIGQWVLGRYWRVATPAERQEYMKLFEDLIVVTYVNRFNQYSGEKLVVTRTTDSDEGGDVIVYSEIARPGGSPIEVGWRVRTKDGSNKIVDVYVEGISMGQTQRSEFGSIIQNNGGSVAALLDEMRRRLGRSA
jgi:phospholipid transport system substrate-binding protein